MNTTGDVKFRDSIITGAPDVLINQNCVIVILLIDFVQLTVLLYTRAIEVPSYKHYYFIPFLQMFVRFLIYHYWYHNFFCHVCTESTVYVIVWFIC